MKKTIIIAGGSGFLGKALKQYFDNLGWKVLILTRKVQNESDIYWDGQNKGVWSLALNHADVLINLAGKSVDCRYTNKAKRFIKKSRIKSTEILQEVLQNLEHPPALWVNASSATIYKGSQEKQMTEEDGEIGNDFSMDVCKAWENEFFKKTINRTRKVAIRTSIVLGTEGGAFPKMKAITRLGMGGHQGNGHQKISWIHVEDFCRAIEFIISHESIQGVINVTSPYPISNKKFMAILRKSMSIKLGLPQPKWLLELGAFFIRTETELLLKSRCVIPQRLMKAGFNFEFVDLKIAIRDLLEQNDKHR